VASVVGVLGSAYPVLVRDLDRISETVEREEGAFRRTLDAGSAILEEALRTGGDRVSGDVAFRLHDTHGFPIELTMEMAAEAGVEVDAEGFERAMASQRAMAQEDARRRRQALGEETVYRELLDQAGPTQFTGYEHYDEPTTVVAVLPGAEPGSAEIVLDRTPFYAESGGQVGDTGVITTATGQATVHDTQVVVPGLIVHRATVAGELHPGQDALAVIDAPRREATRRHHTGTHLLHSALRQVLGDHVRQQSSYVAPDRFRFDFSHPKGLEPEEMHAVVDLVHADVLTDAAVEITETSKAEADALGALAFFGDKYGDRVRVVRAGVHSVELCGGTHVDALGMIGPLTVISEGSIGSNKRRIEAVTGAGALTLLGKSRDDLAQAAEMLRVEPDDVVDALQKLLDRQRQADKELQRLQGASVDVDAARLVEQAADGVVVDRQDGRNAKQLRELAQAARGRGARVVVLAGSDDGTKVALVVASGDAAVDAGALVRELAPLAGGKGGGSADLAAAGGSDPAGVDTLLAEARRRLGS
jgi:alanyl-tRNA synthetase